MNNKTIPVSLAQYNALLTETAAKIAAGITANPKSAFYKTPFLRRIFFSTDLPTRVAVHFSNVGSVSQCAAEQAKSLLSELGYYVDYSIGEKTPLVHHEFNKATLRMIDELKSDAHLYGETKKIIALRSAVLDQLCDYYNIATTKHPLSEEPQKENPSALEHEKQTSNT